MTPADFTKEHRHGAHPSHLSRLQNFSPRKAPKPNNPMASTRAVPNKYPPKGFSICLPLTFPIFHLAKAQSRGQNFCFSSKIACTFSQQILSQSFNFLLISSKLCWFYRVLPCSKDANNSIATHNSKPISEQLHILHIFIDITITG